MPKTLSKSLQQNRRVLSIPVVSCLHLIVSCGGAGPAAGGKTKTPAISIWPAAVCVEAGTTQQFVATVPSGLSVTWQIATPSNCRGNPGTLSETGLYTAPPHCSLMPWFVSPPRVAGVPSLWASAEITLMPKPGTLLGTFTTGSNPEESASDAHGNLWVTNWGANTVSNLFLNEQPSKDYPTGLEPEGITVDAGDNIWVANNGDGTLMKFSRSGERLAAFTAGVKPHDLVFDAIGESLDH